MPSIWFYYVYFLEWNIFHLCLCWFFLIVVHLLVWFVISDCKLRFSFFSGSAEFWKHFHSSFSNSRPALYFQFGIFHIMWIGCDEVFGSQKWLFPTCGAGEIARFFAASWIQQVEIFVIFTQQQFSRLMQDTQVQLHASYKLTASSPSAQMSLFVL